MIFYHIQLNSVQPSILHIDYQNPQQSSPAPHVLIKVEPFNKLACNRRTQTWMDLFVQILKYCVLKFTHKISILTLLKVKIKSNLT